MHFTTQKLKYSEFHVVFVELRWNEFGTFGKLNYAVFLNQWNNTAQCSVIGSVT